jgi:ferredoxin-type protein NapF
MQLAFLKKIRVVVSLIFFIVTVFVFVDFTGLVATRLIRGLLYLQFIPSFLKFIDTLSIAAAGFLFILIMTIFFGRVYCSTVCPLGTLQDIFTWISRKFRIRKRFKFTKPQNWIRYMILGALILIFCYSSVFLVNLLDPYSLAGKIFSNLFRPLFYLGNNLLSRILQLFDSYAVYSVPVKVFSWPPVLFSFSFLVLIIFLAVFKGRWYCNTLCPVGTLLGIFSRFSIFKIRMEENACTSCGLCAIACKAGCIDVKEKKVDFSRCVACYDCFKACPEDGIGYKIGYQKKLFNRRERKVLAKNAETFITIPESLRPLQELSALCVKKDKPSNPSRRNFFKTTIIGTTAILSAKTVFGEKKEPQGISVIPVTPPGSVSIWHFTSKCTSCHLCVSACPTKVLQPTFMEYGWSGMFQPKMDYHAEFCNFECVKCSEVCPTSAILPITKEQKATLQIGISKFIKNICIVVTKHTVCGACSEHCPTKAVEMVPYLGNLTIPKVDEKICVGCGACEYTCPTKPDKAIYVEANSYHRKALKPKKKVEDKKKTIKPTDDFPF